MSAKKPASDRTREIEPFGLRLPPELKAALAATASAGGRSLNAEIVHRLTASTGQLDRIEASLARIEKGLK